MLRLPFLAIANLLLLLRTLLGAPFRMFAAGSRPAYVRFRLTGDPPYREQRKPRFSLGGGSKPEPADVTSLETFGEALRLLARDAKVKGVLLEVEGLGLPQAKRDALLALLAEFRAAGKRVVTWAVMVDTDSYPVLCAADEVLLAPMGRLELVGYAAESTALGEGLSRIGIRPQFIRRGDYKTAPELFTHPEVSDIQRRTVESFLDERYSALVEAVSAARKKTPDEVRALIDQGPYSAQRAQAARLVDGLVSEVDLPLHLGMVEKKDGAAPEDDDTELEPMEMYLETVPFPPVKWRRWKRKPRLAFVPVSGMIVPGSGNAGGRFATSDAVVKGLRAAARDKRSKAILLYVNSPGGAAIASEQILEVVQRVAKKKPVIAYMDRVCASAGYMVALGAKELWSAPHAVVGSIGVFAGKFDTSGLMQMLGIHKTVITRGANAGLLSFSRAFTEGERAALEADIEEMYQSFLGHVAKARGRTKEEIHALAEGRVYSGLRAKEAGLVDKLGGFEEACRYALSLAKVAPGDFELKSYGAPAPRMSILKLLMGAAHPATYALCPVSWDLSGDAKEMLVSLADEPEVDSWLRRFAHKLRGTVRAP